MELFSIRIQRTFQLVSTGLETVQSQERETLLVNVIQNGAFPAVHHIPEHAQGFQIGDAGLYQAVIDSRGKVQRTFQHKAVCLYRYEQIIERTDCGNHPVTAHCSGQVEQHHIIMHVRLFLKRPSVRHAIRRGTADNRVSLLLQPPGLFHQKILIDGCGLYHFHIPFFLFDD